MATEVLRLGMNTTGFEAGGKRVQGTLAGMSAVGTTANRVLLGLGVTMGAAGLVVGLKSAVSGFIAFDSAMTQSLAIMRDVDAEMRDQMIRTARDVAEEVNFAAKDAAQAYYYLASAGLDAAQSVAALPAVARFARAGMFDFAQATDLATDAQSALGLTVKDAQANLVNLTRVTDALVSANTLANASVQQFSTALTSEAGAALKTFNKDVEEGLAVLAAFADQGVKAEVAGSGLSRILRLMGSAAVSSADAYDRLGVHVFDAAGNMRNMADIVEDLENALLPMSDATRIAALESLGFQARVQGVILPLLGMSEKIRAYEAALRDAAGTTKDVSDNQMKSLENRIGQIRQSFSNWRDEIVERAVPAIELLIDNADKLADALKSVFIVAGAAGLVAIFAALGPGIFGTVAAFVALVPAINSASAALALLHIAMGPTGWVVAGLTAATAAVYLYIRSKRAEAEAIEEARKATATANAERLASLDALTKDELKYQQVLLETSVYMAKQQLNQEGWVANDDPRIAQLQEMEARLARVNGLLTDQAKAQDTVTEAVERSLTPFEKILQALKDINEQAENAAIQSAAERWNGPGGMVDSIREWTGLGTGTLPQIEAEALLPGPGDVTDALDSAMVEPWEEAVREIQRTTADAFEDMLRGELTSFEDFADRVLDIFIGLASQIAAAMAADALGIPDLMKAVQEQGRAGLDTNNAGKALKYGGGAIVGAGIGYQTGNVGAGVLSGAGAGLALGGPVGGILGGIGGLVGGLIGQAEKAKEAARQFRAAVDRWEDSLDAFSRMFADEDPLTAGLRDLAEQTEAAWDALREAFKGKPGADTAPSDMPSQLLIETIIKSLEDSLTTAHGRIAANLSREIQFWEQALKLANESGDAAGRAAEQEEKRIAAIQRSLDVEQLVLEGRDEEARALQNQIELLNAEKQGYTEAQLAQLEHIQALRESARVAEEAAAAQAEAARLAEGRASFEATLARAVSVGSPDDIAAQRTLGELDIANTLKGFQEFADAGVITADEMNHLAEVLRTNLNTALEDLAAQAEAAALAVQRQVNQIELDVSAREAALAGDSRASLEAQLQARRDQELAAAQDLLAAGTITETLFDRIAAVLAGEMDQALRDFDQSILDAAKAATEAAAAAREAAAAERYRAQVDMENLRIRLLVAEGRDSEAQGLRNQLELMDAIQQGRGGEYIALLQQVQAAEAAQKATERQSKAIEATTKSMDAMSSQLNSPKGIQYSLLRWRSSLMSTSEGMTPVQAEPLFGQARAPTSGGSVVVPTDRTENRTTITIPVSVTAGSNETDDAQARRIAPAIAKYIEQELRAGAPHLFNDVSG